MSEVNSNELYNRDGNTNALIPILTLVSALEAGDQIAAYGNKLYKIDPLTNARIPIVELAGGDGNDGYLLKVAGLSEFFNETDGGGLVYKDAAGHEVAGICLNGNYPQLYVHRYNGSALTNRVLLEVHEDGVYVSTVLTGTAWERLYTEKVMSDAAGIQELITLNAPFADDGSNYFSATKRGQKVTINNWWLNWQPAATVPVNTWIAVGSLNAGFRGKGSRYYVSHSIIDSGVWVINDMDCMLRIIGSQLSIRPSVAIPAGSYWVTFNNYCWITD
jgi:hypothetical protein